MIVIGNVLYIDNYCPLKPYIILIAEEKKGYGSSIKAMEYNGFTGCNNPILNYW